MNEDNAFGHSLRIDDGDLVVREGQIVVVAGQANLTQALTLRILTPYASDQFNTTYGLDVTQAFTQPNGLRMVKELIKLNLVRTLGADPRVRDIREVLFDDDPAYLARHPELSGNVLRDQHHRRMWQVDVVLDTVQDQPASLSINLFA